MNEWRQEDVEKAGLADWQDMKNEKEGEINCTQVSGLNDWLAGSPIQDRKCCLGESQEEGWWVWSWITGKCFQEEWLVLGNKDVNLFTWGCLCHCLPKLWPCNWGTQLLVLKVLFTGLKKDLIWQIDSDHNCLGNWWSLIRNGLKLAWQKSAVQCQANESIWLPAQFFTVPVWHSTPNRFGRDYGISWEAWNWVFRKHICFPLTGTMCQHKYPHSGWVYLAAL